MNTECKACNERNEALAAGEELEDYRLDHTCGREWPRYVNVYEVGQAYGGSEEGSWWFDVGTPIESVRVDDWTELNAMLVRLRVRYELDEDGNYTGEDDVQRRRGRTSCAGGYDIEISVQDKFAEAYPTERPRYE